MLIIIFVFRIHAPAALVLRIQCALGSVLWLTWAKTLKEVCSITPKDTFACAILGWLINTQAARKVSILPKQISHTMHFNQRLFATKGYRFKGPSTLATLFSHRWPRFCGGDIYSRRKPLFSNFGEHTAVCGSSVRQAVARPSYRQSVFVAACHFLIIIFMSPPHVALVCSGPPQKRGHLWLNKVASVLGPKGSIASLHICPF